jgi:hypothetical protein
MNCLKDGRISNVSKRQRLPDPLQMKDILFFDLIRS